MKSQIALTGIAALFASVVGANAMEYKPFVGATMGIQGVHYSNEADNDATNNRMDLPEDFISFGLIAGVRFGAYNEIYNSGVNFNFDKTSKSDIEHKFLPGTVATLDTTNYTIMYDNYIRISGDKASRIDLVLGAGAGVMNYRLDPKAAGVDTETVYSPDIAFRAGLDFELSKNFILSADARVFVPTRSHFYMRTPYVAGGAIKYVF